MAWLIAPYIIPGLRVRLEYAATAAAWLAATQAVRSDRSFPAGLSDQQQQQLLVSHDRKESRDTSCISRSRVAQRCITCSLPEAHLQSDNSTCVSEGTKWTQDESSTNGARVVFSLPFGGSSTTRLYFLLTAALPRLRMCFCCLTHPLSVRLG
ncbi:hypothetical protein CGRA01v4_14716 [Colletotrichum graminicola]|nr:hypothetical protein CGRA01v4_14716 [Colletotrichum graminicola]